MSEFKVTEILSSREWGEGDRRTIYFDVRVEGQDKAVNFGRKPGNEVQVGDTLKGSLEDDGKGKFKFVKEPFRPGGGGGMTPEDRKRVTRLACHKSAVQIVSVAAQLGLLETVKDSGTLFAAVKGMADLLEGDLP